MVSAQSRMSACRRERVTVSRVRRSSRYGGGSCTSSLRASSMWSSGGPLWPGGPGGGGGGGGAAAADIGMENAGEKKEIGHMASVEGFIEDRVIALRPQ